MKKFINPEMSINRFDVENIVTGSTASQEAEKWLADNGGVTAGGSTSVNPESITIVF